MTLESIIHDIQKWQGLHDKKQAQLDKANDRYDREKENWNKIVNRLTPQMYKLSLKIEKAKIYEGYYKREKGEEK
jgi:hypothetical protein